MHPSPPLVRERRAGRRPAPQQSSRTLVAAVCVVASAGGAHAAFRFRGPGAPAVVRSKSGPVRLEGDGPPVVFSPGLYGSMPAWLYSDFLRAVRARNVTVVTAAGWGPMTDDRVADIADALDVDAVGLVAHSSLDASILQSPRVYRAALCDPVVLRLLPMPPRIPYEVAAFKTTRAYAHGGGGATIPDYLGLRDGCREETFYEDVAHADLLDDRWAELAHRLFPWMAPNPDRTSRRAPSSSSFRSWRREPTSERPSPAALRAAYRDRLATDVVSFVTRRDGTSPVVPPSPPSPPDVGDGGRPSPSPPPDLPLLDASKAT